MNTYHKLKSITLRIFACTAILFSFVPSAKADQVDNLIKLLKEGPVKKKAFAADALAEIGDKRAIAPLIEALITKNTYFRSYLTQDIAEFGQDAVPLLLKACSHKKYRVRGNAANALGKIKAEEAIDTLIALQSDKKKYVRKNAIIALGNFKSTEIMNSQISRISKEKKAGLRSYLVKGLATYNNQAVIPSLIKTSSEDPDSYVRKDATRALGSLGFPEVAKALINSLGDPDDEVQQVAAEGLLIIGEKNSDAFTLLKTNLKSNENASVKARAAAILGNIGKKSAVETLIEVLDVNGDDKVMLEVVTALGKLKDARGTEPLINMLTSFNDPIRRAAVEGLGRIGDKKAIEPLLPVVKDYNDYVRIQAIMVLGDFGDKRALKVLSEVAENDKKEQVRNQAKDTIKRIYDGGK